MNVICIKPTSKLVKDGVYKAVQINNHNTQGYSFFRSTIRIYLNGNSIQTFPLQSFKPSVGDTFQQTNWVCPDYQILLNERAETKIDKNIKSGDYVIPLHDSLKTLIRGRKYKVKEVSIYEHKSSNGSVSWVDIKLKLDGSNRFYSSWNFRKCTQQESREIGLKELFDEQSDTEKVNKFKRKFDYYTVEEKMKLLLQFTLSSANDRFRNQMDIIDWAVSKSAKQYKIIRSDFDSIKDLTLSEILDLLK
jgi:hypothetical protein